MIKINLLPIKAARKREYVKQQLILGLVLIVGAVIGLFFWYRAMEGKIADKKKQIATAQQQIEQFKKAIGEVERYKGLEEILNRKLKIIEDLVKGKTGPVRVLDRLSQLIPKQVWLLSWTEKGGAVEVTGEALSNKNVADLLTLLGQPAEEAAAAPDAAKPAAVEGKRFFTDIKLVETKTVVDQGFNRTFVQFKITMRVSYTI